VGSGGEGQQGRGNEMITRIETQSRKKAKLTRFMDVMDFQILLLTGLVLPFSLWFFLGVPFGYSLVVVVVYMIWMIKFKIDKPAGYWSHYLNFKLRGSLWSAYSGLQTPKSYYLGLRK
jgi:hypothetical protein